MPISDVLPFLGGSPDAGEQAVQGTPLQADTATVAKGLGFPQGMVDRYGDVLGTRPHRMSDYVRDFALGMSSGDPLASTKVHMQVQEQFNKAVDRQIRIAREKKKTDMEDGEAILNAISTGRKIGGKHGMAVAKEALGQMGIKLSPAVNGMLNDHEVLPTTVLEELRKGTLGGEAWRQMLTDPGLFGRQVQVATKQIANLNAIQNQLLNMDKNRVMRAEAEYRRTHRSPRDEALDVMRIKAEKPELADQIIAQQFPRFVGLSDKKIQQFALGRYQKPLTQKQAFQEDIYGRIRKGAGAGPLGPGVPAPPPSPAEMVEGTGTVTDDWIARSKPVLKR